MPKGSPTRLTADAAIINSGSPIRLYHVELEASGGGVAGVEFRNGTGSGDTSLLKMEAEASANARLNMPNGSMFPAGLFVDVGSNVSSVVVWAEMVSR